MAQALNYIKKDGLQRSFRSSDIPVRAAFSDRNIRATKTHKKPIAMIKNYLKIALRHIARNKTYLLINVIGLGVAFACCIVAFINYQYFSQADGFHEKKDQIFRVLVSSVGGYRPQCNVATPLMPQAVEDLSNVTDGIRFGRRGIVAKVGGQNFSEDIALADPNFLEVFTFPILKGNPNALADPTNVLVTEETAKKYFGDEDPIGQVISINPGKASQRDLIVGAVLENIPSNSSMRFDLLTQLSFLETIRIADTLSHWNNTMAATFLVLNKPEEASRVAQDLGKYLPLENNYEKHREVVKYHLMPMIEVFNSREQVTNNWLKSSESPLLPVAPAIMALLILLTACLNFTNTTISFSNKRLKEMGVRKVMGSNRRQLIVQLLSESFIICLLALALGMVIAHFLTPLYNQIWEFMYFEISLNYLEQPMLIVFLLVAVLVAALLGGAYPAFYMTSFEPTSIFRGSTKFGGDTWLVRSLLGLQIVISLVAIIGGVTFAQNAAYQQNYDLGYDVKGVINVSIDGADTYQQFKTAIAANPDILGVAGAVNNLGFGNWWTNLGKPEDNRGVQTQYVGENFLEVMDITLLEGRDFDKNRATDFTEAAIINKKLLDEEQWDSGLGKEIEVGSRKLKIIGVTENFIPGTFFDPLGPNVFQFRKPEEFQRLKVKVPADKLIATNAYLKKVWDQNFPFVPYEGFYQDEVLATTMSVSKGISSIFIFLSLIALLLAATGLYSLVSLNLLKRAKEIAIRRVVGASTGNIAYLINKHYLLIFFIGSVIGGIGGVYTGQFLLEEIFQVHEGVSITSTLLAVAFVCLIGALTIGGKLMGVLRTNPAETLKSE